MLSEKAGEIVRNTINVSTEKNSQIELKGTSPLILSHHSGVVLAGITYWYDRVDFFWFENRLFIEFYKADPMGKEPPLKGGIDWYPKKLREKLGIRR